MYASWFGLKKNEPTSTVDRQSFDSNECNEVDILYKEFVKEPFRIKEPIS